LSAGAGLPHHGKAGKMTSLNKKTKKLDATTKMQKLNLILCYCKEKEVVM